MDQAARAGYDATRNLSRKPFASACYAPFVSLLFDPRGFVRSCCQDWTHDLGNVTQDRLRDIWDGQRMAALRKSLMAYDLPSGCANCQWHIEMEDPKGAYARQFDGVRVRSAHPEWPEAMEFMLSNACNLECIQCVGELSSSIRKHRDRLPPLPHVYDDRFIEDLRPFLHHLDHATFMGGEPFLGRENFRIWDAMIEENTRFFCVISTNGTVRNERVDRVLDELPCMVVVSLDGATRETVESIRKNARFDDVMANIRHFRARARSAASIGSTSRRAILGASRGFRLKDVTWDAARNIVTRVKGRSLFGLSFCLMPQNYHEFGDFLALAEELECEAFVNTVYHPVAFSMSSLSRGLLENVVKTLEKQDAGIRAKLRLHLPVWDDQLAHLRNRLKGDHSAPRNVFLTSVGIQIGVRSAESGGAPTGDARAARAGLLEWSGALQVDEITIDGKGAVEWAPTGFAGLHTDEVRGRSLAEVLLRLRERYGGAVEVQDEPHPRGSERTMTFKDLSGRSTLVRWIAMDGAAGGIGTGEKSRRATLMVAVRTP